MYIYAYTYTHMYTKEIIILYYILKNFIKINFPVGKYLFKQNEIISEGQIYPLYLNFIRNISQWYHMLGIVDSILCMFIMETIIAATPSIANNYGFGCSVSHSSQP